LSDTPENNDKTRTHIVLTEGTMVGHYRIVEKIGAGGMGEVYLAGDTMLNRQVALKFLPQHLCQDEDCRARFKREAQAAAKLNHPNIITIYEVSDYNGRPYFAMEFVEGQQLKDFIQDDGVTTDFAVDAVLQLCEGLDKAHREGIVHRDIKPSNIIIDAEGNAKLVDFGLATIQQDEKLTKTGSTLGTIGYMPPEQIKGKEADQRSDLFSLGVVLYEMLTGKQPFRGENEAATLNAILNDTPEPIARYKSDVPEELQRIVTKLMEKDPAFRYQTAAGVIADLKKMISSKAAGLGKRYDWWNRYVVVGAVFILIIVAGYWLITRFAPGQSEEASQKRKMLAVLPFENLGLPEDEYFADGITDEITSRLAMVHGLGVISRTSAYAYKESDKTLPQIAKELGVDYILEGTIRWDKSGDVDKIRVTPQLIFVKDDVHIWADNYDRTLNEIFTVQADIAIRIVDTLGVTLLATERQSMELKPTNNFAAYDLYLQGKKYWDRDRSLDLAVPLLEAAVEADPDFAQAHRLLARSYGFSYFNYYDRSDEMRQKCLAAAKNAVKTSNGGIEGNIAMGFYHYYLNRDYDQALEQFEIALKTQPNNSEILSAVAFVRRRQGKWQLSTVNLFKATEIDPHARTITNELLTTLFMTRSTEAMQEVIEKSLVLRPDDATLMFYMVDVMLRNGSNMADIKDAIKTASKSGNPAEVAYWLEHYDVAFRDYESALNRRQVPGGYYMSDTAMFYLSKADIYSYLGRDSMSRKYYDSSRIISEARLEEDSTLSFSLMNLADAYAGLGRFSDAIRVGQKAVEIMPISRDALYGSGMLGGLCHIYIKTGEHDDAIDLLDSLMKIPSGIYLYDLQNYPIYDPLRDHPRFQALLEKYDTSN
jgi:non-specific serine/threonine protein kinase